MVSITVQFWVSTSLLVVVVGLIITLFVKTFRLGKSVGGIVENTIGIVRLIKADSACQSQFVAILAEKNVITAAEYISAIEPQQEYKGETFESFIKKISTFGNPLSEDEYKKVSFYMELATKSEPLTKDQAKECYELAKILSEEDALNPFYSYMIKYALFFIRFSKKETGQAE